MIITARNHSHAQPLASSCVASVQAVAPHALMQYVPLLWRYLLRDCCGHVGAGVPDLFLSLSLTLPGLRPLSLSSPCCSSSNSSAALRSRFPSRQPPSLPSGPMHPSSHAPACPSSCTHPCRSHWLRPPQSPPRLGTPVHTLPRSPQLRCEKG